MIIKLINTTNEEIILRNTLLRESGEDSDSITIPSTDKKLWGNDIDTQTNILSGNIKVELNGEDIENVNNAINFLKDIEDLDVEPDGRQVVRTAATRKGWHYQAHAFEIEINKLGSVVNVDEDGNDLGFCELKVYDEDGDECTTQASADTDGVKTVVTWKPDFDFEIVSGSFRQDTKETQECRLFIAAKIATGLAAPNDWLKIYFGQGGVNLNFIGADEALKTDGRAPKLMNGASGDHFEFIFTYEANQANDAERHKLSIILEIYKDPLT